MKLSIIAVATGFVVLPVIAFAQGKDSTATVKDSTATSTMQGTDTTSTAARRSAARARRRANAAAGAMAGMDSTATRTSSSNGTDCPRGCPTSKGAAGLTGVQFLALQQELRDRGCGNTSVTGVYDGATRHAVAVCAKRLSVAATGPAVLVALNIGYSASDVGATPPGGTD